MKITDIRTVVAYGPRRKVFGGTAITALGGTDYSEHAIVFIDTDAGVTGIGEISSVFSRRGHLLAAEVGRLLAPVLAGRDPLRITHLAAAMERALPGSEPARAGVEMALWDILGKSLGAPIHMLLGGLVRDRIPLSYSIPFGTPEEMAEFGAARVAEGFRTVKVKVGQEAGRDIEAVRQVRAAVGDEKRVRVDANMAWRTPKQAAAIIDAMAPYRPELIEQPLPARELDGMAEIRRRVSVPIMADESVWGPRDAMEVIRRGAADVVNVYVSEAGGILAATKIFTMCEQAGIPCMIGSMPEFGIGTAAQIHLGVAMTNLGFDSDTCGSLYHAEDLLIEPLRLEDGYAHPPEGPGLGVEIDMAVLERWSKEPAPTP